MMNLTGNILTVDIGNTAVKGSVFYGDRLLESIVVDDRNPDGLISLVDRHGLEGAIYCSVGSDDRGFAARMRSFLDVEVMELTHSTPLPIEIEYDTPLTLGLDRVAGAVGTAALGGNVMTVDAGTAVTLDIVSDNRFKGGNISPGLRLRFRSLNEFTSRLPLVGLDGEIPMFGRDTHTAIRAGVVGGLTAEIVSAYRDASKVYPGLKLLLTGGDADFIASLPAIRDLGCAVVDHQVVGRGLAAIFKYNRRKQ